MTDDLAVSAEANRPSDDSVDIASIDGRSDHGPVDAETSESMIQSLKEQVASLKQVVLEPDQVLVHRARSYIVHVGCVAEAANNPVHWRTRCGWSYGLTNFYRLLSMQTGFRGCRKCFREADCQLASESEGSSHSSEDEGSSSSSG